MNKLLKQLLEEGYTVKFECNPANKEYFRIDVVKISGGEFNYRQGGNIPKTRFSEDYICAAIRQCVDSLRIMERTGKLVTEI